MPRGPRSRPAHLAQARAFEGINHVFIGSCSAVVRKNSVTHRKARGSIRDAIRRGSDWHGLHRIPRGAAWTLQQLRETTGFADYSAKPGPKRPSLPRFPRGWIGIGVRLVAVADRPQPAVASRCERTLAPQAVAHSGATLAGLRLSDRYRNGVLLRGQCLQFFLVAFRGHVFQIEYDRRKRPYRAGCLVILYDGFKFRFVGRRRGMSHLH